MKRTRTIEEEAYQIVALYLYGPKSIGAVFPNEERARKVLKRARAIAAELQVALTLTVPTSDDSQPAVTDGQS